MKPLLLTIALLFSTPSWAFNEVCFFSFYDPERDSDIYNEFMRKIKSSDCNILHMSVRTEGLRPHIHGYIAKHCRFDRQIIVSEKEKTSNFACEIVR